MEQLRRAERVVTALEHFGDVFRAVVPADYRYSGGDILSHQDTGLDDAERLAGGDGTWLLCRAYHGSIPVYAFYYGNTVGWWGPEPLIRGWLAAQVATRGITREAAEQWLAQWERCAGRELYRVAVGRDPQLETPAGFLAGWYAQYLESERRILEKYRRDAEQRPAIVWGECSACGARVPARDLLNASLRAGVCPDCYDRFAG